MDAIARDVDSYLSRLETEERVEHVQSRITQAGLIEINHAAFRLTRSETGRWRWLLVRENGTVVANSTDAFGSRDEAAESVSMLKEVGPDAPVVTIDEAAYDCYRERGKWYWRLIDQDGSALLTSLTAYPTHREAREATNLVKEFGGDAVVQVAE